MNTYYKKKHKRYKDYKKSKWRHPKQICPICAKPISNNVTAINHTETMKKAHFDCIINELKKFHNLTPKEDLYYLGGGSFGIIEGSKGSNTKDFVIKRRIQYEER
jgi:hypothetical protein